MRLTPMQKTILSTLVNSDKPLTSKELIELIYGVGMYDKKKYSFKVSLHLLRVKLREEGEDLSHVNPFLKKFITRYHNQDKERAYMVNKSKAVLSLLA